VPSSREAMRRLLDLSAAASLIAGPRNRPSREYTCRPRKHELVEASTDGHTSCTRSWTVANRTRCNRVARPPDLLVFMCPGQGLHLGNEDASTWFA